MTLNKHQGIRAALCWIPEIAALSRQHNDANVLAMPGRFVSDDEAIEMVKTFLSTAYEGGRHQRRIDKIPGAQVLSVEGLVLRVFGYMKNRR